MAAPDSANGTSANLAEGAIIRVVLAFGFCRLAE
jgi:hypothetical protein